MSSQPPLFDLKKITEELTKGLKPRDLRFLRSCKTCYYGKQYPLCTVTSPPSTILSEYWAHNCLSYSVEEPVIEPTIGERITVKEVENLKAGTLNIVSEVLELKALEMGSVFSENIGQLVNGSFERGVAIEGIANSWKAVGWLAYGAQSWGQYLRCVTSYFYDGMRSLMVNWATTGVFQVFNPPINSNEIIGFSIMCRGSKTSVGGDYDVGYAKIFYSDGTSGQTILKGNYDDFLKIQNWKLNNITYDANKWIISLVVYTNVDAEAKPTYFDTVVMTRIPFQRIKGVEGRLFQSFGNLDPDEEIIVCDLAKKDVTVEALEFATDYENCDIHIYPYEKDGSCSVRWALLNSSGVNLLTQNPLALHSHPTWLWNEDVYNEGGLFKFTLKRSLRFPNGVKISRHNHDTSAHNAGVVCLISIQS